MLKINCFLFNRPNFVFFLKYNSILKPIFLREFFVHHNIHICFLDNI